jgi:hypothetical protein
MDVLLKKRPQKRQVFADLSVFPTGSGAITRSKSVLPPTKKSRAPRGVVDMQLASDLKELCERRTLRSLADELRRKPGWRRLTNVAFVITETENRSTSRCTPLGEVL